MKANDISPVAELGSIPLQGPPNLRQRILVVEDDVDIRRLNAEVLIRAGYLVAAAKDGALAWDALQLVDYDLLITDNGMPELTGIELLKKIHAARMTLPVIMATGTLPTWEFSVYPWLQPKAVLLKPYTSAELLGTVKEILCLTTATRLMIAPPDWQSYWSDDGLRP